MKYLAKTTKEGCGFYGDEFLALQSLDISLEILPALICCRTISFAV